MSLDDHLLAALRLLLRSAHLSGPDDLAVLVSAAGAELGSDKAVLLLIDYDQRVLTPLPAGSGPGLGEGDAIPVEGSLAGRAFADVLQYPADVPGRGWVLFTPLVDSAERLGVLRLEFAAGVALDDQLLAGCRDVATLLASMVVSRSLYGDVIERSRRSVPLTIPAELLRRQLPPLTFVSPHVAVAGVLAPTGEIAGDCFDHSLNGDILHVAIFDAMGHGLEAAVLAAVTLATLRNARRAGLDLADTVVTVDAELGVRFGPDTFVTGIVGELDVASGWWRWVACGHHPALLVRGGQVVKELDEVISPPLGVGLLDNTTAIGSERLQPGDRLLLYTDGVIEARDRHGTFFGTDRLVELTARQAAAGRPAAETLRRLNHAILDHQEGVLQDDASAVLVEWRTAQSALDFPRPRVHV